jgi:hypothetical protein
MVDDGYDAIPAKPTLLDQALGLAAAPAPGLLAEVRNGAWLGQQNFPPLRYHVPGIVPEGLGVLAGAPKVGKSWLVLGWLLAIAAGGKALGALDVPPGDVLYLALEDGDRRMRSRCGVLLGNAWRPDDDIPARFEYMLTVGPGLLTATITEWLEAHPRGLVVVDTLGKALPPAAQGETAYMRDYRVTTGLKAIADAFPGAALLVNHHDRKAVTPDFVDSVSGTNGIAGGADTVLVLTRPREDSAGLLQVTGRDVTEAAYALTFERGVWSLDGGGLGEAAEAAWQRRVTAGLADRSADIVAHVLASPLPVTVSEVSEALGLSSDATGKYLRRAADAGRIVKAGRGRYFGHVAEAVSETSRIFDTSDTASESVSESRGGPDQPALIASDTSDTHSARGGARRHR